MTFAEFLVVQLTGSFALIRGVAQEAADSEWAIRIAPGMNPVGFTVWHCARSIDWSVNCAIRGESELADMPNWSDRLALDSWFGYEVTPEAALSVSQRVSSQTVAAYLEELEPKVLSWLKGLTQVELDAVPNVDHTYRASGRYVDAPWLQQALDEDRGTPVWRFITGPCGGHIRLHTGEAQALLQVMRSRVNN